ncbi:MAG: helix-turn-helix domain-containing protein [Gemmataceae bacterium]|nr:helix-turn-helix domain-containing protein [Gemmataceae bacterium]
MIVPQTTGKSKGTKPSTTPAALPEILTLAEAAGYLRVTQAEALNFIENQGLPARKAGTDWRILKQAIDDWLASAPRPAQGIWASVGAFKDDPDLEEIVKEAYRRRGRKVTEDD